MRVGTVKLSWPTRCQGAKFAYWRERFSGCFLTLLTLHKLFKLVDDLRIGNLAYKGKRAKAGFVVTGPGDDARFNQYTPNLCGQFCLRPRPRFVLGQA